MFGKNKVQQSSGGRIIHSGGGGVIRQGGMGGSPQGEAVSTHAAAMQAEAKSSAEAAYSKLRNKTAYEFAVPSLEPAVIFAFVMSRLLVSHLYGIVCIHSWRWAVQLGERLNQADPLVGSADGWLGAAEQWLLDLMRPAVLVLGVTGVLLLLVSFVVFWKVELWLNNPGWTVKFWVGFGTSLMLLGGVVSFLHLAG